MELVWPQTQIPEQRLLSYSFLLCFRTSGLFSKGWYDPLGMNECLGMQPLPMDPWRASLIKSHLPRGSMESVVCVRMCTQVPVCVQSRGQLWVSFLFCHPCYLRQGLSLAPELARHTTRLTGHQTLEIYLPLPLDYKCMPSCPAFLHGFWWLMWSPQACKASLLQDERFS